MEMGITPGQKVHTAAPRQQNLALHANKTVVSRWSVWAWLNDVEFHPFTMTERQRDVDDAPLSLSPPSSSKNPSTPQISC